MSQNSTPTLLARLAKLCTGKFAWICIPLLFVTPAETARAQLLQQYIVMRVDFQDSGTTPPRYTRQEVEQQLDSVSVLFTQNSNNTVKVEFVVTDIFRLPKNRAAYGSGGGKMAVTLQDAVANAPTAVQALWTKDVHAIVVLLSQTSDGGGSYYTTQNVGAGGNALFVGNAVVGENPGDTDRAVWGRWAHEVGHNMQVGASGFGAVGGHPSGYQSDFDLMDSNYPGRIGAVSLQPDNQFRGWLLEAKYQTFTPAQGGGNAAIWAIEYDQNARPNVQAVKVEITPYVYYMVSVRRRVRGDELNDSRNPRGIPDEGVLIERVDEVTNPVAIATVIGRTKGPTCSILPDNCNRNELWRAGDIFRAPNEVTIEVTRNVDPDNYLIRVIYNDVGLQPDVMINPWVSPPGNTWETTDIWVDSPVNGFGVFRYGMWDDGSGQMVPVGNGDDPAVGLTNRVHARIRNVGKAIASNVVVTIELTDPPGMGIMGATGWVLVGTADATTFPQLASIPAGGTVDVFVDWTPSFTLTPAQTAAGVFYFHSCLRLRMNTVAGETVLANQDGDREQENIDYFQVPPRGLKAHHVQPLSLRNDDLTHEKSIILAYRLTAPPQGFEDWHVQLNNGVHDVTLAPGEVREIPVEIVPGRSDNQPGQRYSVDVYGLSHHFLVNNLNRKDIHSEFRYTGGARIEGIIVVPTRVSCRASVTSEGLISVVGQVRFAEQLKARNRMPPIMAVGWHPTRGFIESSRVLMTPDRDGRFRGSIKGNPDDGVERVDCMFSGTTELSSALQRVRVVRTGVRPR
jgi:hypothetical protein